MKAESQKIEVLIKWNKESMTIEPSQNDTLDDLKALVYSFTMVQPDKQKIIFKGKVLKESTASLLALGVVDVC